MTLEQLKSEAREEYGDGDYEWNDLDTLITTAFNAGLERAVEVVEAEKSRALIVMAEFIAEKGENYPLGKYLNMQLALIQTNNTNV